jgi:hypothetical protein
MKVFILRLLQCYAFSLTTGFLFRLMMGARLGFKVVLVTLIQVDHFKCFGVVFFPFSFSSYL